MHDTALASGKDFFDRFGPFQRILDIGSRDVNGTLRSVAPTDAEYIGFDMEEGDGVDFILSDPHDFPSWLRDFDAVVSTSCFEHDTMFWLTFIEMIRVAKRGGYVYINAPAGGGSIHRFPVDCWRFLPDAAQALQAWAQRSGYTIELLETKIVPPQSDTWYDFVAIYRRIS